MIWTIDYCMESGLEGKDLMGFACGGRDKERHEPCIYTVEEDKLSIKGSDIHFDFDFQTGEMEHFKDSKVSMEDMGQLKNFYFGNMNDEQIFDSFQPNWSKITELLVPFIRPNSQVAFKEWSEKVNSERFEGRIHSQYSYNFQNGICHFCHRINDDGDFETISCEGMIKNLMKWMDKKNTASVLKNTEHFGVQLYNSLLKSGILKENKLSGN